MYIVGLRNLSKT